MKIEEWGWGWGWGWDWGWAQPQPQPQKLLFIIFQNTKDMPLIKLKNNIILIKLIMK